MWGKFKKFTSYIIPTIVDDHPGAVLIHFGTNGILNDAFNQ